MCYVDSPCEFAVYCELELGTPVIQSTRVTQKSFGDAMRSTLENVEELVERCTYVYTQWDSLTTSTTCHFSVEAWAEQSLHGDGGAQHGAFVHGPEPPFPNLLLDGEGLGVNQPRSLLGRFVQVNFEG